jgi:NAD+ kinase
MTRSVERATVVTHGVTRNVGEALERLGAVADQVGVELHFDGEEFPPQAGADIAVALGGDGTMLRALRRFLATDVPVVGVNFGRVGFLAAIAASDLEHGLRRVFAGDVAVLALPTLEVEVGGERHTAINDAVVVSAVPGRIIELAYALDGEELGAQSCDGLICATPAGSTAYNLSNGGPVLVWGLDAAVITFVAPHTLNVRPLVVGPSFRLVVRNATPDVAAVVLIDGHPLGTLQPGEAVSVGFGAERSHLATLPEQAFFARYRRVFGAGGSASGRSGG